MIEIKCEKKTIQTKSKQKKRLRMQEKNEQEKD